MWISVILIISVIVIGLIAGSRLSAPGPQRRAVNASFISLAIMAGLFFILVNAFPGDWIVPFFTVACIVVPICVYVGFTRAAAASEKEASKKSFEIPRAVTTWDDEDVVPASQPIKATATTPTKTAVSVAETKVTLEQKEVTKSAPTPSAKPVTATPSSPAKAPDPNKTEPKPEQKKPAAKQAAPVQPKPKPKPQPEKKTETKSDIKVAKTTEASNVHTEQPPEKPFEKVSSTEKPAKPSSQDSSAKSSKAAKKTPKVAEHIQASLTAKGAEPAPAKERDAAFTAAASADLLTGKSHSNDDAPARKSLLTEIEALVERDLNVGRKIAEGASDEEVRAAEAAPLNYHEEHDIPLPSSLKKPAASTEQPASAATSAATPTPAPKPEPKPESVPQPKKEPLDPFTELCNKAAGLRDQGSYAVAAVIFKKAVDAAPSTNDARTAQFDELSCYVKAGETAKAKALAAQLRQSSVLTRFERIKLDAVERMG